MLMRLSWSKDDPHALAVGMTGVKMGDRFMQVGCVNGGRLAAIAAKAGLSGCAVAIVPDEPAAARARKGGEQAGVLIEVEIAPPTRLPADDESFDVAVVDDTGGLFSTMTPEQRIVVVRELLRILRPGGRAIVIGTVPRGGLGALMTRTKANPQLESKGGAAAALEADGFSCARTLAQREGLVFAEGIKRRQASR